MYKIFMTVLVMDNAEGKKGKQKNDNYFYDELWL